MAFERTFAIVKPDAVKDGHIGEILAAIERLRFSGGANNGRVEISGVETSDRFVFSSDQSTNTGAIRFTGASIGRNATHGSDKPESAKFEVGYFFNAFEQM